MLVLVLVPLWLLWARVSLFALSLPLLGVAACFLFFALGSSAWPFVLFLAPAPVSCSLLLSPLWLCSCSWPRPWVPVCSCSACFCSVWISRSGWVLFCFRSCSRICSLCSDPRAVPLFYRFSTAPLARTTRSPPHHWLDRPCPLSWSCSGPVLFALALAVPLLAFTTSSPLHLWIGRAVSSSCSVISSNCRHNPTVEHPFAHQL